jgi:DNA-binding transcriptional LysR family regulator
MTIDLLHLEVFRTAARLGSMTKAAAVLHLAQPTVSARVSELEADVGAVLFTRTPRGVEPTRAGQRFLAHAERCLAIYSEGGRAARSEGERRELKLAAPASLAEALFPLLAPLLVERGFDVSLSTNHSPQVLEMLLDGRIDAGVCALQPVPAGIAAEALPPVPIVCVARPDHPLASQASATYGLAQLAGGIAVFEWSEAVGDLEERIRVAGGRNALSGYIKASPADVARRLVLEQRVVAFLPHLTVRRELQEGELVRLEPEGTFKYRWELMLARRKQDARADQPELRKLIAGILTTHGKTIGSGRRVRSSPARSPVTRPYPQT